MTDEQLQAIAARCEAATSGTWETNRRTYDVEINAGKRRYPIALAYSTGPSDISSVLNAAFIAHAREDVPALLAEVADLRRQLDKCRRACAAALDCINRFGEHAPIQFGGEADLAGRLQACAEHDMLLREEERRAKDIDRLADESWTM